MTPRAAFALLAALGAATGALADEAAAARGRALFLGEAALEARVHGQDFALPAQASRCVNCHGPAAVTAGASAAAAPGLSAATLTQPVRRRGGPPSRYDAAALCTLLRSGIDPAHVMIQRTMPRYQISDEDCRALWLHLNR
jgi:mono/diheme cytochrome c family protein